MRDHPVGKVSAGVHNGESRIDRSAIYRYVRCTAKGFQHENDVSTLEAIGSSKNPYQFAKTRQRKSDDACISKQLLRLLRLRRVVVKHNPQQHVCIDRDLHRASSTFARPSAFGGLFDFLDRKLDLRFPSKHPE